MMKSFPKPFLVILFLFAVQVNAENSFMDVPIYPGAEEVSDTSTNIAEKSMAIKTFQTSDPYEEVVAFYKERFPRANFTSMDQKDVI